MLQATSPEEWCAIHEGGHAVHAYLLGLVPQGTWVQYDPGNPSPKGIVEVPNVMDAFAPLLCSGIRAEVLFGKPEQQALNSTDTRKLLDFFKKQSGDPQASDMDVLPTVNLLHEEVLRALSIPGAREAIQDLAVEILSQPPVQAGLVYPCHAFPVFPMFQPHR